MELQGYRVDRLELIHAPSSYPGEEEVHECIYYKEEVKSIVNYFNNNYRDGWEKGIL